MPVFESGNYVHTTDVAIAHAVVSARQESHAAALYAERSKRPPTVQGPPMITVDGAMEIKNFSKSPNMKATQFLRTAMV